MKKQMKSLLIGLAVIIVLGGVLLVLMNLPEQEAESSSSIASSSAPEKPVLASFELADLQSIEVKNTEEYVINRDTGGENEWIIEELRGLPKYKNNYAFLAMNLADLKANSILSENESNLDQYGLKDPLSKVTGVTKDGARHTVHFGKTVPGGGSVYAALPDSNTVYLVDSSTANRFFQVKTDYLDTTLYTVQSTEGLPTVIKAELGGTVRGSDPIVIESVDASEENAEAQSMGISTHVMVAPKQKDINTQVFSDLAQSFFETYATEIVAYKVTDEQIAQYGLDNPYATAKMTFTDVEEDPITVEYRATEPKDGSMYLMKNDIPIIYKAELSTELKGNYWYQVDYTKIVSRLFLLPFINEVKTLTVTTPEKSYQFDLQVLNPDTKEETLAVTYDGKLLDETLFKKFYQVVIGSTSEELVGEELKDLKDPLLSYTFTYTDSSRKQDRMDFYKGPTRMVYVAVNGEIEFTTRDAYIDKVYSSAEKLINGETITTDW